MYDIAPSPNGKVVATSVELEIAELQSRLESLGPGPAGSPMRSLPRVAVARL